MLPLIPVIELSGSYQAIGKQFGEQYKNQIQQFAQTRVTRIINFVKKYGKVDVNEQDILNIANSFLSIHQHYDINSWDEFLGIAQGAQISQELLLVLNSYTDLRDYICKLKGFNDPEIRFDGCTGFIIDKTMTVDNQIIIGQTWDMSVEAIDYLVIVKKNPDNGPKMVYLTTMGCLALIGLNQHKLAIGTTNLMANDCELGVNYLATINKALMASSYEAMISDIIATKKMSGHSFLCASPNQGNLIEASATHQLNFKLEHFPLVKTNNYGEAMMKYQMYTPEQRQRNSIYRYSRALGFLVEKTQWTADGLWNKVLADDCRNESGAAICNEDYDGKYSEFATLATVLLMPETKTMWVCRGGVVSGQKQEISC